MEDRLVFVKIQGGCSSCFFEPLQECEDVITCRGGCGYKLLEEEPVKIQPLSKYEWYKERLNSINDYLGELQCNNADPTKADKQLFKEIGWLKDYIKENKPTNYQTCTKENTKVGDEVVYAGSPDEKRIIKYIYCSSTSIVLNDNGIDKHGELSYYEINTYKDKE